jgi:hypothetical protein
MCNAVMRGIVVPPGSKATSREKQSPLPRFHHFVAQSHTPRTGCVRFVCGVAAASRNTRFQAARYGLTWVGLTPTDRASFAWRLRSFDLLVGALLEKPGHVEPERFCGLEVETEFEFSRLLDWQLGRVATGALLQPIAYPICYPFMEVRRAHNSLYPSKPHIIPDNVAHTRESEGDTSAL